MIQDKQKPKPDTHWNIEWHSMGAQNKETKKKNELTNPSEKGKRYEK